MALQVEHARHKARKGMNIGVALVLVAFAALVFGLTISKVSSGGSVEAFDHTVRNSITVEEEN